MLGKIFNYRKNDKFVELTIPSGAKVILQTPGKKNLISVLASLFAKTSDTQKLPVDTFTTAQRNALTGVKIGTIIYNSTDSFFQIFDGTNWINIWGNTGLISKIISNENTIALFAAASAGYTFEQGDFIVVTNAGTVTIYMYTGTLKTDVANYLVIDISKINWANILNIPKPLTELINSATVYDMEATPVIAANFATRSLKDMSDKEVLNWHQKALLDTTGQNSVSWNTRLLQDNLGVQSVEWEERKLKDVTGAENLNWSEQSIKIPGLPTYADNAAALAGGLVEGQLYVTPNREVKSVIGTYEGVKRYKALISQLAPIPTQTSGTFTVGMIITITTFVAGDDFSNWTLLSGTENTTGAKYLVTVAAPTTWTNSSDLAYDGSPFVVSINSSGIIAPFENTLGEVPTFAYLGVGEFIITSLNGFPLAKTYIYFGNQYNDNTSDCLFVEVSGDGDRTINTIKFRTLNDVHNATDALLFYTPILIEVYP